MVELEKSQDEIRLQNEELEQLAQTDPLTGIANRRTFMEWFETKFARCGDGRESISIMLIDIDFFKRVNDEHGHSMGDEVICRLSDLLQRRTREGDVIIARRPRRKEELGIRVFDLTPERTAVLRAELE